MIRKVGMAVMGLIFAICAAPQTALADTVQQESLINVNGTQFHNTFAVPGLNTAGFDTTTGLGTLVLTFNPGPGSFYVTAFFDLQLATPFFNEYGTVSGAPASGQSWQIDNPALGTIFANTQNNTLNNMNMIPGTTDNFAGTCASVYDSGCATTNDDVSWAMGFNFTLGASQQEVITLNLSTTAPASGFFLGQHHPVDPNNSTPVDVYFSGQAASGQAVGAPEPSTWLLVVAGLCLLMLTALRSPRAA